MSQRPTEKNLPVLMPTPTQALARQDAIRLSQEHLKAKIPNQHQATGELLSLQQLTSALETGRDRELGWSESFALAAVTQLLQQDQNTIAARATLDGADSVITTSIPKTEAAPVTNNLLEVSPEILNDPDFKKHLNDREVSLEPKTSHPWLKNSLSQLGLSGLRTVLSTLVRFLPDWIRKEIEDYTPISDDVTWSLAESALTPSRMRYVGRIEDAAPEFLERAAVLNSYVDVSGTGNKLELSTFLKRKGAWGLEQAIWYCKRVDQAPLAEHLARCIFPLDRGYRTLPLAVGLDIGSAQFLDKKGQPLQLEVKIAINLFGGFKVLNAPPAAKSLSYEVQIAGPDYPTDCRTQMLARLKTHLPISDVSTEENKTLLKKLNQLDIDPNNKAEIWHHRLTEQDYRYFASEELAKLYQRSQKNCFALLQGLRMGTCDAIAALEYHQLNQIDGIVALHADVLTIRFDNQFVESPGHVINRVYSSSGHQDLDFTKMMRRTEGKIPKLKRVDLPADLAENQATLVGQSLRRSLLGLENSLRPSLSSQSSKIQKAPELTAQIRLLAGSTISYGRYTQGFFELIKNRALVELIEPSLEQQKPNLVKILRQIHDLSSDCIEPTDIAQFFPKVGDDNKYPELRNKLKAVLISEAKRAVADHDEPVAMAILDWCACQMAPQVNPKSSGVKSVFNYNPNFKISAQDFAEILCLYKKYDDFKNMQLVTLASQYIKEFRALPDVEVTYQILEPIFFMAEKFDLLGNIDHMAALYAVACERLGKLDLDNPNNQRLAMLLETNLVVFNLIILNSGIERFVMKLIYACRELDSAAVGRGLRLYNQGRSLGMDQKIQEALGRILPSDAIAFCRVFNSVEEALCEIETAINLGLPEDLSEHKAEYQKLVHTVFSQVPKSPQVPGPAQKLVAHLSRIARGDQLIRELERRAAFGDYPIDLDRPDALEEMLCISELCKDLKLDFNLQNPTEVIINFSKLRACGCIDLSQLGLPHDLHDKSLWSLALIKYQLSDRTSSSSELESSSSQDTPFSVLFQDFIRTYRMQWQTCLLDLNNQDLTAKASVLKPHALYSNLRHPQLKQDTTIKSGYVQMLLRNSGISPQELYVAMLKFSAKSSSYKMECPADILAADVFAALQKAETRWLGDVIADYCQVVDPFVHEIIPNSVKGVADSFDQRVRNLDSILNFYLDSSAEREIPDSVNRVLQHAQLAQSYLHRYPSQSVKYFCRPADFGMKFKSTSGEFFQQVSYVAGDDLRSVDWKAFGRSDQLYSRVARDVGINSAHILVDVHYMGEFAKNWNSAIHIGSKSLEQIYSARVFQLLSLIVSLQAQAERLPIRVSLCDTYGRVRSFRYRSEQEQFKEELCNSLILAASNNAWSQASCHQFLEQESTGSRVTKNTAFFVFAAPETIERQVKQIEFLRKKGGALNIVSDQSARIVHF